mmetsp:Transcript_5145/g.9742  ORF Transcript_5145/g.9742 Transcript_5145/m.9742 type:complete len:232 (-) Transcript_5145:111-806(-)
MQKLTRELKWLRMEGLKTEAGIIEKKIRNLKRKELEDTKQKVLEAKKKFDEFKVTEKISEIKADIQEDLDEARAAVDKTRRKQTLFGKAIWKDGDRVTKEEDDEEVMLGRVRSSRDILKSRESMELERQREQQEQEEQARALAEEEERERERREQEEEDKMKAAEDKKKSGSAFAGLLSMLKRTEEKSNGDSDSVSDREEDIFATPRSQDEQDEDYDDERYEDKSSVCVVM